MTETLTDPPPAPPPPSDPRRLVRDPDDRVVAGVCAAFARYTDTDPVLWRVTVAVLTLFGGAGLALYALGWVLVPKRGEPRSFAERTLRRPDGRISVAGIVAAVIVAVVVLALLDNGPGIGALIVVGGIAYLVSRERRSAPPAAATVPTAVEPASQAPRERSPLGVLTLSAATLVLGVLTALRQSGVDELTTPRILAAVLLVLGAGLLVGTWWGRARWLLPIGLVVALLLAGAAATGGVGGGVGERTWRATDGGVYSLGAGEATLDLRGLRGVDDAEVRAHVGVGQLTVLVPYDMSVRITSDVRLGVLNGPGPHRGPRDEPERNVHEEYVVGTADDVTVELDLEVGMGEIEVRRVAA